MPVLSASPSGVAGRQGAPRDVPGPYAEYPRSGCGPGASACTHLRWVVGSLLGPARLHIACVLNIARVLPC